MMFTFNYDEARKKENESILKNDPKVRKSIFYTIFNASSQIIKIAKSPKFNTFDIETMEFCNPSIKKLKGAAIEYQEALIGAHKRPEQKRDIYFDLLEEYAINIRHAIKEIQSALIIKNNAYKLTHGLLTTLFFSPYKGIISELKDHIKTIDNAITDLHEQRKKFFIPEDENIKLNSTP